MFCPVRPCSFGLFGLGFVLFGLAALAHLAWAFFRSVLLLWLVRLELCSIRLCSFGSFNLGFLPFDLATLACSPGLSSVRPCSFRLFAGVLSFHNVGVMPLRACRPVSLARVLPENCFVPAVEKMRWRLLFPRAALFFFRKDK